MHVSLNALTVINWKRYFKENKIKKYLGKIITKEVVIIKIESYLVFMQIKCNFPDISYLSETQKNKFQFLNQHSSMCHLVHCLTKYSFRDGEVPVI